MGMEAGEFAVLAMAQTGIVKRATAKRHERRFMV
jgi:hypothetical protein